ncbi:hypothetical protein VNO77_34243 [Canavalia gladiata]|uniref:protein disulfide-isomerase n=1 Tax=Canavalia gladiata TaxID=3824 RepID=A0AAN9KF83_CANGL
MMILSNRDPPIVLAKVDANDESNTDLASQYDFKGFPTIKILRDGGKNVQEYKGPCEVEGIVDYLKRQSVPASSEIKSVDDVAILIGVNKVAIVGIFPKFSREEFNKFTTLAEKLRFDYDFGHTVNAKYLPNRESSMSGPIIGLFKPFDELFFDFQDFHRDALEKFVEESSIPLVILGNPLASIGLCILIANWASIEPCSSTILNLNWAISGLGQDKQLPL